MLTRRDLLRGFSLSVLAVTAAPLVAGCDEGGGGGSAPAVQDLALVASDVRRVTAPGSAVTVTCLPPPSGAVLVIASR